MGQLVSSLVRFLISGILYASLACSISDSTAFMAAYTVLKDIKVTCTMQVFLEV